MILTLYKTLDRGNVINKTLTNPEQITIFLKSDVDILSPELLLEATTGVSFSDYNYCHIDELNRYYFINEVVSVNNNIVKLICGVDCIETYKANILNSEARYGIPLGVGDYGDIRLDVTGRKIETDHVSDVELEPDNKAILSVMGGYYNA